MIVVYFELDTPKYAELVAKFDKEEDFLACLPSLEKQAKLKGFDRVTETEIEEDFLNQ